ncbi:putative neutral ceramidase C [Saccoglossus kowalevskii]
MTYMVEGSTEGNFFWDAVRDFIHDPSQELIDCHQPKPILLPTGELKKPYPWHPDIVDTQIFQIGSLAIVAVPGEFSTMSGRRLRDGVKKVLIDNGWPSDTHVVIAGLSNVYTHYITTFEEYQVQRYEGASTIYGPHTLSAYKQQFEILAAALAKDTTVDPGPAPPFMLQEQISLLPPVFFDRPPLLKNFGDVLSDVLPVYTKNSNVNVTFVTANPRNSPHLEDTYLSVQFKENDSQWQEVYNDADWCTRYEWIRKNILLGESDATIYWDIPSNAKPGSYRIQHSAYAKHVLGGIKQFLGTSSVFEVK